MTIGILQIQGLLIQAVGLVYQAATATPVVSSTMGTAGTGGLLQGLGPTRGSVGWTATTSLSAETATIETTAFLLVASGMIKVCVHQVIVSDIYGYVEKK
jgi:hypothetical protein